MSEEAAVAQAPVTKRVGVTSFGRALVRQLVAAVYSYIAFAMAAHFIGPRSWTWLAEPVFVVLGAALTGRLIEGRWWTSSFLGLFVALFDDGVDVAFSGLPKVPAGWIMMVGGATLTTLVGVLGGWIGRWWRRRV